MHFNYICDNRILTKGISVFINILLHFGQLFSGTNYSSISFIEYSLNIDLLSDTFFNLTMNQYNIDKKMKSIYLIHMLLVSTKY